MGTGDEPDQDCECGACGPNKSKETVSYFIQLNLKSQFEKLFSKPKIFEDLQYRYNRKKENMDAIEDIHDDMCLGMSLSVRPFSDPRFSSCSLWPYSLAGELAWLHVRNGRSALIKGHDPS